jgi:hypothetical protein
MEAQSTEQNCPTVEVEEFNDTRSCVDDEDVSYKKRRSSSHSPPRHSPPRRSRSLSRSRSRSPERRSPTNGAAMSSNNNMDEGRREKNKKNKVVEP